MWRIVWVNSYSLTVVYLCSFPESLPRTLKNEYKEIFSLNIYQILHTLIYKSQIKKLFLTNRIPSESNLIFCSSSEHRWSPVVIIVNGGNHLSGEMIFSHYTFMVHWSYSKFLNYLCNYIFSTQLCMKITTSKIWQEINHSIINSFSIILFFLSACCTASNNKSPIIIFVTFLKMPLSFRI